MTEAELQKKCEEMAEEMFSYEPDSVQALIQKDFNKTTYSLGFKAAVEIMQGEVDRLVSKYSDFSISYAVRTDLLISAKEEILKLKQTQEMLVGAIKDCEDAAINYDLELEGWQIREITDKALAALEEKK